MASGTGTLAVTGDEAGSASSANGRIALNAALGKLAPYDEWLAFVIARKMGHVIARHHEENSAASMAT
jgi:Zn-dependent protease with chaperone function